MNEDDFDITDDNNFEEAVDQDILFWNFKEVPTIICKIISTETEKLEYEAYLAQEIQSKEMCYIPNHSKIKEAVEKHGLNRIYKITHKQEIEFGQTRDGKKKTYNSYTIQVLKQK